MKRYILLILSFVFFEHLALGQAKTGSEGLNELIALNMKYPAKARQDGLEGTVLLSVKIDKTGLLDTITILETPSELLTEEVSQVMRLVKENWNPEWLEDKSPDSKYLMSFQFLVTNRDPATALQLERMIEKENFEKALNQLDQLIQLHPYQRMWLDLRSKIYYQLGETIKFQTDYIKSRSLKNEFLGVIEVTAFGL